VRPTASSADIFGRVADALSVLFSNAIRHWLGAVADVAVLGRVTWADLGATLCFILAAVVVHGVARVIVGSKARPKLEAPGGQAVRHHVFGALGRPLYTLIWVYGLYFIATPILRRLDPDQGLEELRVVVDSMLNVGLFAVLCWFCVRLTHVLETRLGRWAAGSASRLDGLFVPLLGRSLRLLIPVLGIIFALPMLDLPARYGAIVAKASSILLILALGAMLFQLIATAERAVLASFDITLADNLRARKVYTQVHVIGKVMYVAVGFFTVATVLMLFPEVRHVGTSLLTSAGIVGIVAGIAAQKTLANVLAGFQIALAQPMRQDDVLIVEGEWGRVEEITLTYVVVRIWDDRRLILPLSYFIEKPFQNWTRTSAQLLGSVLVWVDYSFPVEAARQALQGIIAASPLWDKRFWNLQVSDATERTMQLRVLATAADASRSWDLRCEIREKFIAYIQSAHPQSLPQLRMTSHGSGFGTSRIDAKAQDAGVADRRDRERSLQPNPVRGAAGDQGNDRAADDGDADDPRAFGGPRTQSLAGEGEDRREHNGVEQSDGQQRDAGHLADRIG
jgi:small-conductance mechanosensitive channel